MAKIYKVRDLLETNYLYTTTLHDLEYLVHHCVDALSTGKSFHTPSPLQDEYVAETLANKSLPTLDVAGMHITDVAAEFICTSQLNGYVTIIDSEDEGRMAVLDANIVYKNTIHPTPVQMPPLNYNVSVKEYIKSLNADSLYSLCDNSKITFATVLMCLSARPEIKFDLTDNFGIEFFEWMHTQFEMSCCERVTEFYAFYKHSKRPEIDVITYDPETYTVETREKLHMDFQRAWVQFTLVPAIFNTPDFYRVYKDICDTLYENALDIIKEYYSNAPRDMYELLQHLVRKEA